MRIGRGTGRSRSTYPSWISCAKARAKDNRGVGVLEAAFVTPVFFMLVLGIIEVGLVMNDYLALASSVRAGSRAASASGNETKADMYTIMRVGRESTAIRQSNIDFVVVYKPAGFGQVPSPACRAGTSVANVCNVYTRADVAAAFVQATEETNALAQGRPVDPAKIKFGCGTASPDRYWCPNTRKVTQSGTGPEYVGVWMKMQHPLVTNMFGTVKTLTDQSVIRLEPRVTE